MAKKLNETAAIILPKDWSKTPKERAKFAVRLTKALYPKTFKRLGE